MAIKPEATEFTKKMRKKYKESIKQKLCVYAPDFKKALDIIDVQQAENKRLKMESNELQVKNEQLCKALKPFVYETWSVDKWTKDEDEWDCLIPAKWIRAGRRVLEIKNKANNNPFKE